MSTYTLHKGVSNKLDFTVKVILIIIGGLIGIALGLYVAARTLPIPTTTNNYIYSQ